jgi:hypothetical protein
MGNLSDDGQTQAGDVVAISARAQNLWVLFAETRPANNLESIWHDNQKDTSAMNELVALGVVEQVEHRTLTGMLVWRFTQKGIQSCLLLR